MAANSDPGVEPLPGALGRGDPGDSLRGRPELVRAPQRTPSPAEGEPAAPDTAATASADDATPGEAAKTGEAKKAGAFEDEPTTLDTEDMVTATEGAQILRLDAFRKKRT